jgi:hypothetical protein
MWDVRWDNTETDNKSHPDPAFFDRFREACVVEVLFGQFVGSIAAPVLEYPRYQHILP